MDMQAQLKANIIEYDKIFEANTHPHAAFALELKRVCEIILQHFEQLPKK